MDDGKTYVWVFNGGGTFPSGVFSSREAAGAWIAHHALSGCLTKYPLDQGAYEWAIETGFFTVRREDQRTPDFVGRFACGTEHYHYASGTDTTLPESADPPDEDGNDGPSPAVA